MKTLAVLLMTLLVVPAAVAKPKPKVYERAKVIAAFTSGTGPIYYASCEGYGGGTYCQDGQTHVDTASQYTFETAAGVWNVSVNPRTPLEVSNGDSVELGLDPDYADKFSKKGRYKGQIYIRLANGKEWVVEDAWFDHKYAGKVYPPNPICLGGCSK